MRTYYKTTITVTILSDGPYYEPNDLATVGYDIRDGDHVGQWGITSQEKLTHDQAVALGNELGSDGVSYFGEDV